MKPEETKYAVASILAELLFHNYEDIDVNDKGQIVAYCYRPKKNNSIYRVIDNTLELNLPKDISKELSRHLCEVRPILEILRSDYALHLGMYMAQELEDSLENVEIVHKPNKLVGRICDGTRYLLTLNGVVRTNPGDWIITGVNGEKYPCDPEIFKELYELA